MGSATTSTGISIQSTGDGEPRRASFYIREKGRYRRRSCPRVTVHGPVAISSRRRYYKANNPSSYRDIPNAFPIKATTPLRVWSTVMLSLADKVQALMATRKQPPYRPCNAIIGMRHHFKWNQYQSPVHSEKWTGYQSTNPPVHFGFLLCTSWVLFLVFFFLNYIKKNGQSTH